MSEPISVPMPGRPLCDESGRRRFLMGLAAGGLVVPRPDGCRRPNALASRRRRMQLRIRRANRYRRLIYRLIMTGTCGWRLPKCARYRAAVRRGAGRDLVG